MPDGLRQFGNKLGHVVLRVEGMKSAALLPRQRQQQGVVKGNIQAETMHRKIVGRFRNFENHGFIAHLRIGDQNQRFLACRRMFRRQLQHMP